MQIGISCEKGMNHAAQQLADSSHIPFFDLASQYKPTFLLHLTATHLELHFTEDKSLKPLYIDFLSGKNRHRRLYGGGKGQQLAKAIGLNKYNNPSVIDTTAGLGRDAFVLATLGCTVTLIERSLPVYLLLQDAIDHVHVSDVSVVQEIIRKMTLLHVNSSDYLSSLGQDQFPDVIYIDPMFPPRKKSAKVKKDMALFHQLVGKDEDSEQLLELALSRATKRIVVKRPKLADSLLTTPNFQVIGKSTRYDIYLPESH